jgi:hypothetical protein
MTITVRTLAILLVPFVAGTAGGITLLLRDSDAKPAAVIPPTDVPTVLSADELRTVAESSPVYWAGVLPHRRLEVTTTERGTFVRYLPAAVRVGKREQALTVATYELEDAWSLARQAAHSADARERRLADGRIAVWRTARPTSVYLAQPGSTVLVEVFDPDAKKARHLSLAGLIRPVS